MNTFTAVRSTSLPLEEISVLISHFIDVAFSPSENEESVLDVCC